MLKPDSALREQHEQLLRRHYAPVYRFLRNMTRRSEDAADLTQQTFVRAITAWSRYDERLPLLSWLFAIAYREFCTWRRGRLWIPLRPDRLTAADQYGRVEDADVLLNALARLNQAVRATFLLHYVEELSIIEISALLDIPEGTVKSRLHLARTRLKSLLQEDEAYVPETV